jgi:hypothetical protein
MAASPELDDEYLPDSGHGRRSRGMSATATIE